MKITSKRGRAQNSAQEFTRIQVAEIMKCRDNPIYFINNYFMINHPIKGPANDPLFPYQESYINTLEANKNVIAMFPRQARGTSTSIAYLLWYSIFHSDQLVMAMAPNRAMASELAAKFQFALSCVPAWLRTKATHCTQRTITFENGTKVLFDQVSNVAIKGRTINFLYLDSFAYVPATVQFDFWSNVSPMVYTAGKVLLNSTPNTKVDVFANIWHGYGYGGNTFTRFHVKPEDCPQFDPHFLNMTRKALGESAYKREFDCEFV